MLPLYLRLFTMGDSFPFTIRFAQHTKEISIHTHEDFSELVIVLHGTAVHVVESEEYLVKKGDVFVIHGNIPHGYKDADDLKICNILYQPEWLHEVGNDLKKSAGYQALFILEPIYRRRHHFNSKLQLPISTLEYSAELTKKIFGEYTKKEQGYQTMIYSHFMELVVFLSRQYNKSPEKSANHLLHLAKAVSFIEDRYLENISLEEVADKAHLSHRHFNRIFLENYKTTPIKYITHLRLQHACQLLQSTKCSISDIASKCGFNDSNYFSRQFKTNFKMTPKEYRNNMQNNIEFK